MNNPVHKEMIESFHIWYEKEKGIKFIWDAKQTKQVDYIYDKLFKATQDVTLGKVSETTILILFDKMLANLKRADKWIYDNVSPSLISSKFNELVAKIKGLGTGKGNYQDMKLDLINKMVGK